jgi:hypothetical protein
MRLDRLHWLRKIATLDPETDYEEIYRIVTMYEFPWDMNQSLGFALYRTYAVPSIGSLLARTGEFTGRTQKRYDDTGLILSAIGENGLDSPEGRAAIRRMNQMHGHWGIPNDDLRYVLATFVIVPIRWLDEYGYRALTDAEKVASANYYRRLGQLMNIKDLPATWQEFGDLMDAYERTHFGYDEGAVAVSEATLALMGTFPPNDKAPARVVRRSALAMMDEPLLAAFGYRPVTRLEQVVYRGAIKLRARALRHVPARAEVQRFEDLPQMRTYPDGYEISELGTFPARTEEGTA